MNETVKKIVDMLFAKTVDNEETRALHDEVMNNCQEHYADLVARGLSEDDAIHEVIVSLKGMEDVIAEYKIREEAPAQDHSGDTVMFHMPKCPEFTLDGVKRIKIETASDSISVQPSENGQINLHYDGMNQTIVAENIGETLKIGLKKLISGQEKQEAPKTGWRDVFPKHEDGSFSFNLKALGEMISNTMGNVSIGGNGTLTVEIPAGAEYVLEANSRGGDVRVDGCCNITELKMNSTGGDVSAELDGGMTLREIAMNSTSGDINLEGNADKLTASTISGDVDITGSFGTATLKSVSGDVELNGSVHKLLANSVSGDVTLETENAGEQDLWITSVSGDAEVDLPDDVPVCLSANTGSGDVENRHPNLQNAPIKIYAKTASGDINVL